MTDQDIEGARRSFTWWLRHIGSGVAADSALRGPTQPSAEIEDVLLALRADRAELPRATRRLLGPLRPPTYDDAARLLLWARHAPEGPRCRSYRAALRLLQRLEQHDVDGAPRDRVTA